MREPMIRHLLLLLSLSIVAQPALADDVSDAGEAETGSAEPKTRSEKKAMKREARRDKKIDKIAAKRGLNSLDPDVSEALKIRHAIRTRNIGRATTTGGVVLTAGGGLMIASGVAIYREFCPSEPILCIFLGIPMGVAVGTVGGLGATGGIATTSAGLSFRNIGMKHLEDLGQPKNLRKRDAPAAE